MLRRRESSRRRFEEYKRGLSAKSQTLQNGADSPSDSPPASGSAGSADRLRSTSELVREFYHLLRGQRLAVALALFAMSISTSLGLIPPAATKFIIDYVLTPRPLPASTPNWLHLPADRWQLLLLTVATMVSVSLLKIGVQVWGRWYAIRTSKRLQMSVRKRALEHAIRLPLHRVQELRSGGVASVLRADAGSVGDLVFVMLCNPWRAVVQLMGSLCVLAWIDWRLLIGALLMIPAVYFSHRTWISRIRPRYRDIRAERENVDARATEAFGGIRVVRGFSRQSSETGRIMNGNHLMGRQELSVWWWARVIEIVWDAIIPLCSASLMLYGGWQVLTGNLTIGDLMMFLVYLLMLLEPIAVLAQSATQFQNSLSGLDRVLDLLDEPRELASSPQAVKLKKPEVRGAVTFENIGFRYSPEATFALQHIDLEVQPGQTIALVGPSGAGKTTLCNLVARFYDPQEGRILLDGRDLRDIEVENYRNILGIVEQDVFLFDGTVADNIIYADRSATEEDVFRAARVANADGFICEMPDGYETVIGERGIKLSGGQRQRIAIARAVLADPRILILDEATSNLDSESERLIQESLHALMQQRTSFVIAHRLSTIRYADCIVVLDKGRVLEVGTHDELIQRGGEYRAMVQAQVDVHGTLVAGPIRYPD